MVDTCALHVTVELSVFAVQLACQVCTIDLLGMQ